MTQMHQNKKCDIIAHTLASCGIPLWHGIPEKIINDLKANGYKVKKSKRLSKKL